jgi:hypothetical protein
VGNHVRADARCGHHALDLVFFADSSGVVHHVGIDAGGAMTVESPRTGEPVRIARCAVDMPASGATSDRSRIKLARDNG